MNLIKYYRNEIILIAALLLFIGALLYKYEKKSDILVSQKLTQKELKELKELQAAKRIWGDKNIKNRVEQLRNVVPVNKYSWHQEGKKLKVDFKNLSGKELNRATNKILNLPVSIEALNIVKNGKTYGLECKCKW